MKLNYDRKSKDPTYFAQIGFRDENGKPTTRNVKRFGKHSELLKITDDPVAYCKEEIRRMNEELKVGKSEMSFLVDFKEDKNTFPDLLYCPAVIQAASVYAGRPGKACHNRSAVYHFKEYDCS